MFCWSILVRWPIRFPFVRSRKNIRVTGELETRSVGNAGNNYMAGNVGSRVNYTGAEGGIWRYPACPAI